MTREEHVKQIERERREREDALLLLLLSLTERGRLNVVRAIRVGGDWEAVLNGVLLGDAALDFPGGVQPISRVLGDTYLTGYQRAGALAEVTLPAPLTLKQAAEALTQAATESLQRVLGYLTKAIRQALADASPVDRINADVTAVNEAFDTAGWQAGAAHGAKTEATRLVIATYNAGLGGGYQVPQITGQMTGLVFVNPLDPRTTTICRRRAGTMLPTTDRWFDSNWPPLHENCRSLAMPLFRAFIATANPPTDPPAAPGWGERYPGWVMQIDKLVSDYRRFFGIVPHDPINRN